MEPLFTLLLFWQLSAVWAQQLFDLNPDIFRNTPELIRSRGFDYEQHTVTTRDGYILTLFRMVNPHLSNEKRKLRPVLLWHGIAVTSDSWLFSTAGHLNSSGIYVENNAVANDCDNTVTDTLGYTLSACGYDVWLGNSRGSQYSNRHTRYNSVIDPQYWRYTLTELALYDVPAAISYVLRQTNQSSLSYVGHSLGTTQMFALLSLIPEIGQVIRPFVALAPVAYIGHIWSSARLGVPLEPLLKMFPGPLGLPLRVMQLIAVFICGNDQLVNLCANIFYSLNGFDPTNFNRTIVPVNMAHSATPTSTWLYAHLAQLVANNHFRMFDLGVTENRARYGQNEPPEYPISNITSPHIAIFRGLNDPFADNDDVNRLVNTLRVPLLDNYIVPYDKWNHQDFQLGITQGFYVNRRLLRILRQFD